jgi:hypothetical protein
MGKGWLMTNDEIKATVTKYIVNGVESDNADGLHEMDEWWKEEDYEQNRIDLEKGYKLFRKAQVTVTFDE